MKCQIMMKRRLLINSLLFIFPLTASAGWEVTKPQTVAPQEPFFQTRPALVPEAGWKVTKPQSVVPREPFFQARPVLVPGKKLLPATYSSSAFPNQYADLGQPAAVYAVSISGSLKENVERIMSRYHWKVKWKASYDFNFDGRVTGSSLPNVVSKLFQPFPLQAVMYPDNRTLLVIPRSRA